MYFRPPPRPSPASVAYSDDEDAMSMAKPPIPDDSSSSVTDKPSDLGDSTEVSVDCEQSSILLIDRLWPVRMQKGEDHFLWAYEPGYTSVLDDLRDVGNCTDLEANTAFVSTQSFLGGVLLYCPQSLWSFITDIHDFPDVGECTETNTAFLSTQSFLGVYICTVRKLMFFHNRHTWPPWCERLHRGK